MPIRLSNIRLGIDEPELNLSKHIARVLGLPPDSIQAWRILRKSLDVRRKNDLQFVYTALVQGLTDEQRVVELARRRAKSVRVDQYAQPEFCMPPRG